MATATKTVQDKRALKLLKGIEQAIMDALGASRRDVRAWLDGDDADDIDDRLADMDSEDYGRVRTYADMHAEITMAFAERAK